MPGTVDTQELINARKLSGFQITVLVLCFLVVAVDGFDTAAVGDVEPAQVAQWKVTRPQLAPLFGAGIGTGGSQIGINAPSAAFCPTASRATGVSRANAVGRISSVVGLLSFRWDLGAVFSMAAGPAFVAALAIFAKGRAETPASLGSLLINSEVKP